MGSITFSELSVRTIEQFIAGGAPLSVSKNDSQLSMDELNKIQKVVNKEMAEASKEVFKRS